MRALPPPASLYSFAWVLACVHAHGVRVSWSGSMTYQGARLPLVEFLGLSPGPLTPAGSSSPLPPHSSALLSRGFPNGDGETLCWGLCRRVIRSGNLVVSNARLNQQLKVMAPEAREGWDITINLWPLAQWCMCLWVPAQNACDLQLCVSAYKPTQPFYTALTACLCGISV